MMHVLGKRKGDMSRRKNPICLILSPTRELAQQVCSFHLNECRLFSGKELCHGRLLDLLFLL